MHGPSLHGPSLHGPSLHGPSLHGPSLHGPSLHGPSLHGPSLHGPSLHGPSLHGPSLHGPSLHGPSLHGPSLPFDDFEEGGRYEINIKQTTNDSPIYQIIIVIYLFIEINSSSICCMFLHLSRRHLWFNFIPVERYESKYISKRKQEILPTYSMNTNEICEQESDVGLTMVICLFVINGAGGYYFLDHALWNGLYLSDFVFPWFMWIMGAGITFSISSGIKRNVSRWILAIQILRRTALLFLFGVMFNTSYGQNDLTKLRIPGVLQRFAISYFVVATITLILSDNRSPKFKRWWAIGMSCRSRFKFIIEWMFYGGILAGHTYLTFYLKVPGCPKGYLGPGGDDAGGKYRNCTGGAAGYIDLLLLGNRHIYQNPTFKSLYNSSAFDPEGVLGSLTTIFMVFTGVKGVAALVLCGASVDDGWIPINKNLWSISFILSISSTAFIILIILYILVDCKRIWSGGPFLQPDIEQQKVNIDDPMQPYLAYDVTSSFYSDVCHGPQMMCTQMKSDNMMKIPLLVVILTINLKAFHCQGQDKNPSPEVFITVDSKRCICLNWVTNHKTSSDVVGLYTSSPESSGNESPVFKINPQSTQSDYAKTNIVFPFQKFNSTDLTQDRCLDFWIAYVRNSSTVATNCLKTNPNWMNTSKAVIGDVYLRKVMIPGSHNSGSYSTKVSKSIISRFLITQDMSIFNQLIFGIRYLDLRIGAHNNDFWIYHDVFRTKTRLVTVLDDVKAFMNTTNEVIILDFHRFPHGFKFFGQDNMTLYRQLVHLVKNKLGDHMLPVTYTMDVTMNQIWNSGKRLLVAFNTKLRRIEPRLLWKGVRQFWGDTSDVGELKSHLDSSINYLIPWNHWSAMGHLTAQPFDVLFNPTKGTGYYADVVNRQLNYWFRDLWWEETNIVSTDFLLGNNLIEICIKSNYRRKNQPFTN
ncbi:Heparan-alpha-glucosaminide N-acetyltransferase [Nymphon striatum]|nr:Heparan-alpha-glucosaminide N-acetyltransferase [Nymphon striatum]